MQIRKNAYIFLIFFFSVPCNCVIFQSSINNQSDIWSFCWHPEDTQGDLPEFGYTLATCVKQRMHQNLLDSVNQKCVDIGDGVTFETNEETNLSPRDLFPLDGDSSSYRGIAEAYSNFLSRRSIKWDMGHLYPGLVMRIGPTINGDGVLEFAMDRRLDYHDRAKLGPGQQMIRRTILPHLLGFRMNLMTLLPLVFGVLVYVAKNAFIFSKITLVISTLLALKSLFVLQHYRPPQYGHQNDFVDTSGIVDDPVNFIGGPRPKPHAHNLHDNLVLQMFTGNVPPFRGVNDKGPADQFRGVRNFSWQK